MTRKVQFTLFLFIVMALFTACSQDGGSTTPLNAGIANPASENCLRQGGEVEMRQGDAGEYGVCIFADGRVCDEWALYHGVCEQHQVLSAFFNRLAAGQYAAAATLYGGSYETLVGFNPDIDPVDVAALWRHGCEMNGLQCLLVRIASFNEQTAVGYQPAGRTIYLDEDQTQDFYLASRPCVLLVDDDNNSPDVRPYYTAALDALGVSYDVFNAGSGNGPSLAEMIGYQAIIWFTGDKFGGTAGPNNVDAANLAAYLEGGGRLFLSSQDYIYDMGLTPFAQTYLGVGSFTNDAGNATVKYGVAGNPIGDGAGPYPLSYPFGFTDYGDIVNSGSGGSVAFRSAAAGGNNLNVTQTGDNWKTVFLGTSWVAVAHASPANGVALLQRILDWFEACACQPVSIHSVTTAVQGCAVDFAPVYGGDLPIAWAWSFLHGTPAASQSEAPGGIEFGVSGTYTYTVTAVNCDGVCSDTFAGAVTVACNVCEPVTVVQVAQAVTGTLYAGDTATLAVTLWPPTAVAPFTYTLSISGTEVLIGQIASGVSFLIAHTFAKPGIYPVTLAVWSRDLAAPVSGNLLVSVLPVKERHKVYLPLTAGQ